MTPPDSGDPKKRAPVVAELEPQTWCGVPISKPDSGEREALHAQCEAVRRLSKARQAPWGAPGRTRRVWVGQGGYPLRRVAHIAPTALREGASYG